jgi:hypothetical protein
VEIIDLFNALQKANNIIASCETCLQLSHAKNYIENFKNIHNNEELYQKLLNKISNKEKEFNCNFRI